MSKIAFCVIVKPTDEEADLLFRLLENVSPYIDRAFVTITGKNEKCEQVAKSFNAEISHYEWDFNFAKARNYNFSQVPKDYDYIMWADADDMFRGLETLREVIEQNKDADGFTMNYLYSFDERKNPTVVHLKTMIVRNDGCVEWAGALHEDFKENRQVAIKFVPTIERLHITDEGRHNVNAKRNLEIAEKDMQANPEDPRSYWNLANSQRGCNMLKESLETYDKFLELSKSEEEKYIVMVRMAEIHFINQDYKKVLDVIRYAIGMRPDYPDAYHLAGSAYFNMGNLKMAKEFYLSGLSKKPPRFSIVVYNPRDYDYTPLMNLAKVYINLNLPHMALDCFKACSKIYPSDKELKQLIKGISKEANKVKKIIKKVEELKEIKDIDKLKEELENLPDDFKAYPMVVHLRNTTFIKEQSSGKDLVFFCGYTQEVWTPESVKKTGIGGSEEAVINLSKELAKKGWNVEVYNNCGHKEQIFDGVKYKPFWMWNYRDKQDITILWRTAKMLYYDINSTKVYIDLHDVMPEGEFNEKRLPKIDGIFVKSKAHRALFPNIPDNKFIIIPNAVDISLFDKEVERDPYYLINLSSADRGLKGILDIYEEVLLRVKADIRPKVKLGWFYGWGVFDVGRISEEEQQWKQDLVKRFNALKEKGLVIGGERISHEQVAIENLKAGALIYPSQFYEIDWIGGSKAQIAGCVPITSNYAAIGEKVKYGIKIDTSSQGDNPVGCDFSVRDESLKELFITAIVAYLENPEKFSEQRKEMSEWAKNEFNLERIAGLWDKELKSNKVNLQYE